MRPLLLAAAASLASAAGAVAAPAAWQFDTQTSALDGRQTAVATLASVTETPNVLGRPEPAHLLLRCADGSLDAYVSWPGMVGFERTQAAFRFDGEDIKRRMVGPGSDGRAMFIDSNMVSSFFAAVSQSKRLVVRVEPVRHASQEAVFELGDSAPVVSQVAGACGVTPRR